MYAAGGAAGAAAAGTFNAAWFIGGTAEACGVLLFLFALPHPAISAQASSDGAISFTFNFMARLLYRLLLSDPPPR